MPAAVDSTVIIRNRLTGEISRTIRQPEGITSIEFSPDGKFIATASYDCKVMKLQVAYQFATKTERHKEAQRK